MEWNGIHCLNSRRLRLPVAHYREESPIMNPDSVAGPHDNQMVALLISCDSTSRDGLDPTFRLTAWRSDQEWSQITERIKISNHCNHGTSNDGISHMMVQFITIKLLNWINQKKQDTWKKMHDELISIHTKYLFLKETIHTVHNERFMF